MSALYDVTDMLNVSAAIHEWENNPRDDRAIGQAVLDDVAPRLIARAFRDIAERHRQSRSGHQEPVWPAQLDLMADEIEAEL